jgi:hypothetical protein
MKKIDSPEKENKVYYSSLPDLYQFLKESGREKEGKERIKVFLTDNFQSDLDEKVLRFLELGGIWYIDYEHFRLYYELMQLYVNGLFYSTVVLSGVLSERICYDILSKQEIILKGKGQLNEEQVCSLYKINLHDIIELLTKWNLIKTSTRIEMIEINNKRNMYVHPSKTQTLNPLKDSKEMIKRISKILINEFEVKSFVGKELQIDTPNPFGDYSKDNTG